VAGNWISGAKLHHENKGAGDSAPAPFTGIAQSKETRPWGFKGGATGRWRPGDRGLGRRAGKMRAFADAQIPICRAMVATNSMRRCLVSF